VQAGRRFPKGGKGEVDLKSTIGKGWDGNQSGVRTERVQPDRENYIRWRGKGRNPSSRRVKLKGLHRQGTTVEGVGGGERKKKKGLLIPPGTVLSQNRGKKSGRVKPYASDL